LWFDPEFLLAVLVEVVTASDITAVAACLKLQLTFLKKWNENTPQIHIRKFKEVMA
jgi:hypothetical protein